MEFEADRIVEALRRSWSTASSRNWLPDNPARGQCNVTALLINELFGGEILKTLLPEGDHFYNRIDGETVDLTASQFEAPIIYSDLVSSRDEALAGTSVEKYEALRAAFAKRFEVVGSRGC
jgi:hypothetical protein